ncbi:stress responsive A/B barrel domain protein [Lophium mytilinum]|uniref:Stress responsive A/B barrel domain protein n=1 Tax=Lophium mytilinum TaxID=390894 RepID=A0A6A6QHE6_9PEZI|nr:stress responsive A/B barrel domain protein [Lophium mytilinum]
MPPVIHLMICKFKDETLPASQIDNICQRTLALRTDCIHPSTGQPYIKSIQGGTDQSVQGQNKEMTHAFIIEFESEEDRTYFLKEDPVHVKHAGEFVPMINSKDGDFVGLTLDFVPGKFETKGV